MPGLAELRKAKLGQLDDEYKEIENGAEITYPSEEPAVIDAIHRWFDAQLADHGSDDIPGHSHDYIHNMHDMKNMHNQ